MSLILFSVVAFDELKETSVSVSDHLVDIERKYEVCPTPQKIGDFRL